MKKLAYEKPAVIREIHIDYDGILLAGSVVDNVLNATSSGQDVCGFYNTDEPENSFNHIWGE